MDQMTHHDPAQMANQHSGHASAQPAGARDRHAGHSVAMFRDKFWLSFALTIPVVFLSSDVQDRSILGAPAIVPPWATSSGGPARITHFDVNLRLPLTSLQMSGFPLRRNF